jgi:hypothetical protein
MYHFQKSLLEFSKTGVLARPNPLKSRLQVPYSYLNNLALNNQRNQNLRNIKQSMLRVS